MELCYKHTGNPNCPNHGKALVTVTLPDNQQYFDDSKHYRCMLCGTPLYFVDYERDQYGGGIKAKEDKHGKA